MRIYPQAIVYAAIFVAGCKSVGTTTSQVLETPSVAEAPPAEDLSACKLDPGHVYLEDEYPLALCLYDSDATEARACVPGTKPRVCFDCRGRRTSCERVSGSYAYASSWRPPATDAYVPPREAVLALASDEDLARTCAHFAGRSLSLAPPDRDGVPDSPFRFGYMVDRRAAQRQQPLSEWCRPAEQVNCGKWNADADTWRATYGCECYATGRGRSYDNCNDVTLFACPWASGSGCGLHVLGDAGGTACIRGDDPRNPQYNNCHIDVVGTVHDSCCAQHWYVERSQKFRGRNITQFTCNGCNGGQGKDACAARPLGIRLPVHKDLPCYDEWDLAVSHNRIRNEIRYQWYSTVDTEQRFTAQEVTDHLGRPDLLLEKARPAGEDRRARSGQVLLKADAARNVISQFRAAHFCASGEIVVKREVGPLNRLLWICR